MTVLVKRKNGAVLDRLKNYSIKATVTWFLGPHVCLESFLKSRGDGKIKWNENVDFFIWSGLVDCYRRKNAYGPKDEVTVA